MLNVTLFNPLVTSLQQQLLCYTMSCPYTYAKLGVYLPYGGSYWCNSIYSVETLVRAVQRYSINIYTSTTESNGDWRSLDNFERLSKVFTPLCRNTISRPSALNERFLLFPRTTTSTFRINQFCQGQQENIRSDGPMPTPIWFAKKQMISLRGGMLDDKVIHYYLDLLCANVSDVKCSTTDPLHISEYLRGGCDIATIHRRIYRGTDICDSDLVFVPINKDMHWSIITADFTKYGGGKSII